MKQVFTAIAKAIKAALRAALTVARYGAAAVLTPVAALFGGSTADDLPEPEVNQGPLDLDEIEDEFEREEVRRSRILHRVEAYAALYEFCPTPAERRQYVDINKVPLPAAVWARKLTDLECSRIRAAGLQAICDHVTGQRLIPGVTRPRLPLKDFSDYINWGGPESLLERSERLIAAPNAGRQAARMTLH